MMATAFLGYNSSPKWHTLNLSFIFNSFFLENINLSALLLLISFTILYLDGFKLSSNSLVRYFQIFSFVLSILITLIIALSFSEYACHDLYSNINHYIAVHNNIVKK